jgi:hypothetical protein
LIGVGGVIALQLGLTYLPLMNRLFETRPVALVDGIVIIGIGVALFAILEIEKRMQRAVARMLGLQGNLVIFQLRLRDRPENRSHQGTRVRERMVIHRHGCGVSRKEGQ